jgi:hypothetical protein
MVKSGNPYHVGKGSKKGGQFTTGHNYSVSELKRRARMAAFQRQASEFYAEKAATKAREAAGLPPEGAVAKYSDIKSTHFGKGYFISGNDDLYDLAGEFGGGTNDHVGFVASTEHPEALGLTKQDVEKMLRSYENLDTECIDIWKKMFEAEVIRVREFGNEIAIDSNNLSTKTLERLQRLYAMGKFGFGAKQKLTWSDNFEMNILRNISLEEFLQAEHVGRHETSPDVVEPYLR